MACTKDRFGCTVYKGCLHRINASTLAGGLSSYQHDDKSKHAWVQFFGVPVVRVITQQPEQGLLRVARRSQEAYRNYHALFFLINRITIPLIT